LRTAVIKVSINAGSFSNDAIRPSRGGIQRSCLPTAQPTR
jgi:hypothetical protein